MAWHSYFSRQAANPDFIETKDVNEPRRQQAALAQGLSAAVKGAVDYARDLEEAEFKQAKLDAGLALSDAETLTWQAMAEAAEKGDVEGVEKAYGNFGNLRNDALSNNTEMFAIAYDEGSYPVLARLKRRFLEKRRQAEAINSAGVLDDDLLNKTESAAVDGSYAPSYVSEYVSAVSDALIPEKEKKKRIADGVQTILTSAMARNPIDVSNALMRGDYNAYLTPQSVRMLAVKADDFAFYRDLKTDPEGLSGRIDDFKAYDEKTRFERERLVERVLSESKKKQNKGVQKRQADEESALQEIQTQYFADTFKQMEKNKKTKNLFDLLDYREAVGRAYSGGSVNERQFADLMKKTVKPLFDAVEGDKYQKPMFKESVFEYGVGKLNSLFEGQMADPSVKAVLLDAYYQGIKDAGLDPNGRRSSENKAQILSVLNDVARDFADARSGMIIPEKVGSVVLGGRYYPTTVKEPSVQPPAVKAGAGLRVSKDVSGNVIEQSGDKRRILKTQSVPVWTRSDEESAKRDVISRALKYRPEEVPDLIDGE